MAGIDYTKDGEGDNHDGDSEEIRRAKEVAEIEKQKNLASEQRIAREKREREAENKERTIEELAMMKEEATQLLEALRLREIEWENKEEELESEKQETKATRAKFAPALKNSVKEAKHYYDRCKELEARLGIKEEEEIKAADDATHFADNLSNGVAVLRATAKNIKSYSPTLASYLSKQADGLEHETDHVYGIKCFKACCTSMLKLADYLDTNEKRLGYDTSEVYDYLGKQYDKVMEVMAIPDDRGEMIPVGDSDFPPYTPMKESPMLLPKQQALLDKISERIGR